MWAAALFLFVCCASSPPAERPGQCADASEVAGTWRSYRNSQIGPAWVTLTLDCDCRFTATIQGLWMRVRQTGTFDTATGTLRIASRTGDGQVWKFEKPAEGLIVYEAGERHEYARIRTKECR